MEVDNTVSAQVLSCTFSAKEYTNNSKTVFKNIDKDAKNYIKHFLGALYEIFGAEDFTHNRFFALLLLVKATETKNTNLMKQLASSRELLNLIFKDAQIDLSKPLSEKGKTLFSKKPSKDDSVAGNNYMILLLEAICFWKKAYGTDNGKDAYSVMYSQLSERTQMPGSNYYVGQKLTVNDKFYAQPAKVTSIIEPPQKPAPSNKQAAPQKETTPAGEEEEVTASEAFMQLITCVSSEEDYETQSETIFNLVSKNDKAYDKSLLKALNEILGKPIYTNVYKFYTLLLMVQITETGNKTFLNQVVRDNPFLNNLYKLAKDAGDMNGPKMLSLVDADDQEIPHKNQLNILILEAVKYWHTRFGDNDPEHPYANFTKLYQGLVGKVLFPEEYVFIKAKGVPQRTAGKGTTPQSATEVSDPLMKLVNACIPSGDSFQAYYYEIIEYLQTDLEKTPIYLQGTLDILKSPTVDPSSKFYALYLLIKVSELIDDPNDVFISALAKNNPLMSKLFEDAQFDKQKPSEQKGTNFFSKQPNPQLNILASNYIQMLSEILHFWGQVFETVERPDPKAIFKLISSQLKKLTMVEQRVYYIGRDLGAMEGVKLTGFEFIPYKSLPEFNNYMLGSENQLEEEQKAEPEAAAVVVAEKKVEQVRSVEAEKRGSSAPPPIDDLDVRFANLQKLKDRMKDFYFYNEEEKPETKGLLQGLYFQINSEYTDEILPHVDHVLSGQHKETEKYATMISKEGEIIDQLELDYANYIKGDMNYKQLRKRALVILDEKAASQSALNTMQSVTSEARKKRAKEQKFYSSPLEDDKDSQNPSAGLQPIQSPLTNTIPQRGNLSERIEPAAVVVMNQSHTKEQVLSSRSKPNNNLAGQLLSDEESIPSRASLAKVSDRERAAQVSNPKPLTDRLNVNRESLHAGQLLSDNDHSMMSHVSENNPYKSKRQYNINIDPNNPMSQHSMVMTPSRNYDQDLSRLEHSIRMSKAKVKTLNGIEDSIRKSFMNTGKEPPGFKPVADMALVSGLEEEITKLKDEKSELLKENTSLKNQKATMMQEFNEKEAAQASEIVNLRNEMAKLVQEHEEKEAAQASEIENLRGLLSEYQKRIETVQTQLEEVEIAKSKTVAATPATPQQSENQPQQMLTTAKSLTQSSSTPLVSTNKERQMHSPSLLDKFLTRSNYIPISPTQPMRRNESLSPMQSQYLKTSSYGVGGFTQEKSEPIYPSTITLNKNYEPNQYQYENKKGATANSITLSGIQNRGGLSQVKNYTELDKFVSQKPTYWYGDMELQRGGESLRSPQHTDSKTFFHQTNSNVMYVEAKSPPRDHRTPRPAGYRSNLFANLKMKIEKSAPSSSMDAFYNYKVACLNRESVLFENSAIRIDVKTGSVESQTTRENILGITLLYTNKGNDLIRDFSTDFPEVPKATLLHRPAIRDAYLGGRSRTEQQVFFSFEEWPVQVPQMYGQYKIHKEKTEFDVFLPTLITQFVNFRDMDTVESFDQRFQESNETIVVESNDITLDPLIVETSQDFNKYFDKLRDLTQQGQVLGGCFTLKWSSQSNYFLRIRISSSNKVKFTIATSRENTSYVDIILETFTFLFGRE